MSVGFVDDINGLLCLAESLIYTAVGVGAPFGLGVWLGVQGSGIMVVELIGREEVGLEELVVCKSECVGSASG